MNAASAYFTALLPEWCVLIGACLALAAGSSRSRGVRGWTAPVSLVALVAALLVTRLPSHAGPQSVLAGLFVSALSDYVRWITLLVGVLILLINWQTPADEERGEFFGMILFSMVGVMLTASANDLVVLFFALELVSVPTYVLVALSRTDVRASEASLKYFFLGALSAAVMVYGFSFLYGAGGTTVLHAANGPALNHLLGSGESMSSYAILGLALAIAGLSFKIAAVPFHAYVPDVYEGAASSVTALLGFLPKLAGFVGLMKVLSLCGWYLPDALTWLLCGVTAATMTAGNVLALLQRNVKRLLAYSSIAHSGYLLLGILVGPLLGEGPMRDGLAAMLFYVLVYGVMNLGAFAVLAGATTRGEPIESLDDLGGLRRRDPVAAIVLAVCAFGLMGFPPTAGFLGKVYLFSGAFSVASDHPFRSVFVLLVVIAVINSAIGAAYYLRIAAACVMGDSSSPTERVGGRPMRMAHVACAVVVIALFIRPLDVMREARFASVSIPRGVGPAVAEVTPTQGDPSRSIQ